ncbi:MAG: hypothetical protein QME66_08170, partial [Candidatus Eisenbacteria bacterium]|nr:hypothetical protein [Candidatus Eisenbacteria bacterium]
MTFQTYLENMGACAEAITWVGHRTLERAWAECERGDWMIWLVGKHHKHPGWPKHREIVLCACEIAERALRFVPAGEDRPRLA